MSEHLRSAPTKVRAGRPNRMRIARFAALLITKLARLLGVLCLCVGLFFAISAYAVKEHRTLYVVTAAWVVVMGMGLLLTRPVRIEQITRLRNLVGRRE